MVDIATRIEEANSLALQRILEADPVWYDVRTALEVVPGMTENTIIHAGPPVTWERMAGPMKGAIVAALLFEGRATTPAEAMELAAGGEIQFSPCHEHDAVGAMAGVISPSMPVFAVRNRTHGNVAYCGWRDLGQACGCFDQETVEKMHWIHDVGMPALRAAVLQRDGLEIKPLWARGLLMGDEHHNRVSAGTSIFCRMMAPAMARAVEDRQALAELFDYLADFDLAIVPITMAGCKSVMNAAHNIDASTVVTAIARNGVQVGIRVSGLGDRWFAGPAQLVKGTYHPGFCDADACPDLGDSAIIETAGFGGCAIAAAPTHITVKDEPGAAARYTQEMYEITLGRNPSYPIPTLGFMGVPTAIDIRRVVETGILPIVDTPIAHREPGKARSAIGFGMSRPPMDAFVQALTAFAERYLD